MKLRSLEDLLVHQVRILRGAEKQIAKSLPRLAACAGACEVDGALMDLVAQARGFKVRLTQVADSLDRKCGLRSCDPVAGLLEEARAATVAKQRETVVVDVALVSVAHRLVRYRFLAYQDARSLANHAGCSHVGKLLQLSIGELSRTGERVGQLLRALLEGPPVRAVSRLILAPSPGESDALWSLRGQRASPEA
ncbi:MAG: DUF892 family protein [Actinomycetota bacterium]